MPVVVRRWWIQRKGKEESEKKKKMNEKTSQPTEGATISKAPWNK